jgi:MFS family permease
MQIKNMILIFLLWLAGLAAAAQFAKIAVPFGHLQSLYPHLDAELGWLLSLISLVGAVLGIVGGALVGRFGTKRVLLFGLILGAVISFWQASLPDFSLMLFSRVLEGISHLAIVVAAPTLMAQLASDRFRGTVMTIWGTFFGVSFVLVAWLGVPLLAHGGLPLLFALHGAIMTILVLFLGIGLWDESPNHASDSDFGLPFVMEQHVKAYRSPFISAPGIGWLFYTFTFVSLLTLLPQMVAPEKGAWLSGLMPMVSIVSSLLLVPLLLQLTTAINIVVLGLFGGMLVVLATLLGIDLVVTGLALFTVLGLTQGATFAAIPELNSSIESRALGYGVMAQTGNIGNLVGTPVLLAIFGVGGQPMMFFAAAIAYGLAIAAHILLAKQRRQGGG